MSDRYFVGAPITGKTARLVGSEAHHLLHVVRAKRGDRVVLFDGSGAEFVAQVERTARTEVELALLSRHEVDRELPFELTLGVSLPKGDRQKWLVEKVVELGLSQLVPLLTERSVALFGRGTVARLRRTAIEASKQCGRNRLMEIPEPQNWPDFLVATRTVPYRLVAHPKCGVRGADGFRLADLLAQAARPQLLALAVGPEGGFTTDELTQATSAGWQTVDLGPRILRTETAALLLVAIAAHAGLEA